MGLAASTMDVVPVLRAASSAAMLVRGCFLAIPFLILQDNVWNFGWCCIVLNMQCHSLKPRLDARQPIPFRQHPSSYLLAIFFLFENYSILYIF